MRFRVKLALLRQNRSFLLNCLCSEGSCRSLALIEPLAIVPTCAMSAHLCLVLMEWVSLPCWAPGGQLSLGWQVKAHSVRHFPKHMPWILIGAFSYGDSGGVGGQIHVLG